MITGTAVSDLQGLGDEQSMRTATSGSANSSR